MDPRVSQHAKLIVTYATGVKKGDQVLIMASDYGLDLASEIYKEAAKLGGSPLIVMTPSEVTRAYYEVTPEEFLDIYPKHLYELTKVSDVVVSIRSDINTKTLGNVNPKKLTRRDKTVRPIQDERLSKRWCLTQAPTPGFAQDADMSLKEYEDFVYSAILIDWASQRTQMEKLKKALDQADKVRLIGEKTDLTMSVKGRNAIVGDATHNVPGGEVYTAPVDDSAEGEICFDLPGIRYGREIKGIRLKFSKGEVVDYSAETNQDALKSIIETDQGSKRIGELGIGTNRGIKRFTKNILFDEKIGDTIHLALGNAYKDCGGINKSAIHWDIIKTMKPGQILLDGKVLQKDGKFSWE
ncbi:aminopeptidase [Candidatus Bathyarchaeota archaeon]|nr:aminopeptidase [Candidatus Bathyarchaeota archaeon]